MTPSSVTFNNVDTITCFTPSNEGDSVGILFIYTKSNGKWSEQKFTAADVGFRPVGYFGSSTTFLDANTMLVSDPFEGVTDLYPTKGGKLLLMARNMSNFWEPALDIVGPGLFGLDVGVNDFDIIVNSFIIPTRAVSTLYTAPRCFYQPINVTCNNVQVNECTQIDISSLYTVNNPQCGNVVASFESFGLVDNNALQAQLSFSRAYGISAKCNVTVTCSSAPTFIQQQTPTGNVSGASAFKFGPFSLWPIVLLVLAV